MVVLTTLLLKANAAGFAPQYTCAAASNKFFDPSSLVCQTCEPTSQVPTATGCKCKPDYIYDYSGGPTAPNPPCVQCAGSNVATIDREFCIPCGSSTAGKQSDGTCGTCASGTATLQQVVSSTYAAERPCNDPAKCKWECVECSEGARLVNGVCTACPDPRMTGSGCVCAAGYTQLSNACLHTATASEVTALYGAPGAYEVRFPDVWSAAGSFSTSVTSLALQDNFYSAAVDCKRGVSVEACQMLANLCVLQMYLRDASACGYFLKVTQASPNSRQHSFSGWFGTIGFLYFENNQIVQDSTLVSKLAYEATAGYTHSLLFKLAKYAFNGTYLGQEDLTDQLQVCGGHYDVMTRWMKFGTQFFNGCNVRLTSIINSTETIFYDPYFVDSDGTYYPIPIMVMNVRVSGVRVNERMDTYQHVYTRRFMIYDTVSGVVTADTTPDVIRVISRASLNFTMQTDDIQKMFPPVLEIEYAEIDVKNLHYSSTATQGTQFSTQYKYNVQSGETEMLVTNVVFITLAFIFRLYRWTRVNHNADLNSKFMVQVVVQFCHAVGTVMGIMIISYSFYWYAFYKWQGLITTGPPMNSNLYHFWVTLGMAMASQLIAVLYMLYRQCCVTIFFIDWESSQGRRAGHDGTTAKCPVSTWRQLFVANEFNRLQTARLVSFEFTCIWVAALMVGFDLQYAACLTPDGADLYACDQVNVSGILRFAVSTFIWMSVIGLQAVYVTFFHNKYVKHETAQLVDLMCLTNISAFILTDLYAGYYIHGQSNLQHADADLETVAGILKSEEQNIVSHRGLLTDDDTQTFVMHITTEVREKFDDFLEFQAKDDEDQYNRMGGGVSGMAMMAADEFRDRNQRSVRRHADPFYTHMRGTNSNLKGFIKKMQTTYSFNIKEMDWQDRLFHLPPDRELLDYAMFMKDDAATWVSIFYEGIELELMLFDVLLFGFWQICVTNTMIAILLTYITQKAIDFWRYWLGAKNLARTTLVGDRFLL